MEIGEGMVAVVHGLKEAGLAVTLLDSGRQYTLFPEGVTHQKSVQPNTSNSIASQCASEYTSSHQDSAVQATDGRYASTYKMMHCQMSPTSPPDLVTEFPPQKAELYPGHENFEIGGAGSGEIYNYPNRSNGFRSGTFTKRPDGGSVFSSRPSVQLDSFASSLRKYPNLTPDRSSEIVEKLINFTQNKNMSKNLRGYVSPTRVVDSDLSNQTINNETNSSRNTTMMTSNRRFEESPTREKSTKGLVDQETLESWRRSTFAKTNDVQYLRDISKKVREGIRGVSIKPNSRPEKLAADQNTGKFSNAMTVNMEIQAAVQMVSREVVTSPVAVSSQRTIAVPLTPSPSHTEGNSENKLSTSKLEKDVMLEDSASPTTKMAAVDMRVQRVTSAIECNKQIYQNYKRSKSEEKVKNIQREILDMIYDLTLEPCCSKFHRRSQSRINKRNKFYIKIARNCECVSDHDIQFCGHKLGFRANTRKGIKKYYQSHPKIYHNEISSYTVPDVTEILEEWFNLIPLKKEYFNNNMYKEYICNDFLDCIRDFVNGSLERSRKYKFKFDILNLLETLPLEIKGNKKVTLSKLADILVSKIKHAKQNKWCKNLENIHQCNDTFPDLHSYLETQRYIQPTESEIRILISEELGLFLEESQLKIIGRGIKEIKDELFDLLTSSIGDLRFFDGKALRKKIIKLFRTYEFSEYYAICFANILIKHIRESFIHDVRQMKVRSETFIVLPSTLNVKNTNKSITHGALNDKQSNNNKHISNIEAYTKELCNQINEWLVSIKFKIPYSGENEFRETVINELAGDIVDRRKYLELNQTTNVSDEVELEHLKFQIFKWINKLVGEDSLVATEHAPDLMKRIQGISAPGYSRTLNNLELNDNVSNAVNINNLPKIKQNFKINMKNKTETQIRHKDIVNVRNNNKKTISNDIHPKTISNDIHPNGSSVSILGDFDGNVGYNKILGSACCVDQCLNKSIKSLNQIEAEYELFVKNWVKQIPIETTSLDEEMVEKARLGIYNGLWKSISKLNCDPATYYNRFFYEDLLGDAIDELLDCLPQSPELQSKKQLLKTEFIEKTNNINDHVKAHAQNSYKNNLKENIVTNLHKQGITGNMSDDSIKLQEELQIMKLVEEFLLFTRFKNENKIVAELFKKKLLEEAQDFIEDLKKNSNKELNDINMASYKNDLIISLQKVPLPNALTIKDEADEILLRFEVEEWYKDLPVYLDEDYTARYMRNKQLEIFVQKIKEFEKNINDDSSISALRNEASRFLENTPFRDGERVHINFMVDKLINKLKNRKRQDNGQNIKKVAFLAPDSYEEFGKNIPCCSSFIVTPQCKHNLAHTSLSYKDNNANPTQISEYHELCDVPQLTDGANTRKFNIHDNSDVYAQAPSNYEIAEGSTFQSPYKNMSNQWYSLPEEHSLSNNQEQINKYLQIPPRLKPCTDYDQIRNQATDVPEVLQHIHNSNILKNTPKGNYTDSCVSTHENMSFKTCNKPISCAHNTPGGITISEKILEKSKTACPSRYETDNQEFSNMINETPVTFSTHNVPTQSVSQQNMRVRGKIPLERSSQSLSKHSIGCQSFESKNSFNLSENKPNTIFYGPHQMTIGTNTSLKNNFRLPTHAYFPQQTKPSTTLLGPNNKRAKWALPEEEAVKRQLGISQSENIEDEVHCSCTERHWKCRRRPKYFTCNEFDDFPHCLPMLVPYPCYF